MTEESIKTFGQTVPMKRAGQPIEVATCFVFLASVDSSYIRSVPRFPSQPSKIANYLSTVDKSFTSTEVLSSTKILKDYLVSDTNVDCSKFLYMLMYSTYD